MEGSIERRGRASVDHPRRSRASLDAPNLYELQGVVQHYAWGRSADESMIAKLLASRGDEVDATKPFAELWMGTHPSGPSMVLLEVPWRTVTPLYEWLKLNPSMHGRRNSLDMGHVGGLQRRQSMLKLAKHVLATQRTSPRRRSRSRGAEGEGAEVCS